MEIKAQCPKNNQCPFPQPCPWPMHCPPCPDYPEITTNKKEMKKYNTPYLVAPSIVAQGLG